MQTRLRVGTTMLGLLVIAGGMMGSPRASQLTARGGTIWVTERTTGGQSTVAAIDAATGDSLGIVSVGNKPIGITVPAGTNRVYSSDEDADQVSVIQQSDCPSYTFRSATGRIT
jgi:DNA-binding beta-propeller fold protein YncE